MQLALYAPLFPNNNGMPSRLCSRRKGFASPHAFFLLSFFLFLFFSIFHADPKNCNYWKLTKQHPHLAKLARATFFSRSRLSYPASSQSQWNESWKRLLVSWHVCLSVSLLREEEKERKGKEVERGRRRKDDMEERVRARDKKRRTPLRCWRKRK